MIPRRRRDRTPGPRIEPIVTGIAARVDEVAVTAVRSGASHGLPTGPIRRSAMIHSELQAESRGVLRIYCDSRV